MNFNYSRASVVTRELARMSSILHKISPLMPEDRVLDPLHEKAGALIRQATALLSHGAILEPLRPLLRAMNSYYTNRIEGQHARPSDIERALLRQVDSDSEIARRQRLAVSHLEAERKLDDLWMNRPLADLYTVDAVSEIHRSLFDRLPPEDCRSEDGEIMIPGEIRSRPVAVGRHLPPERDIERYLDAWANGYRNLPAGEKSLIGVAASHHRLAYFHPFADGNGRTARLHSHLLLYRMQLTGGLWSVMRGMARRQEEYYRYLNDADLPRRNDLDGRGELSQEGLVQFIDFFLTICTDQVQFMQQMLKLSRLREGIRDLLTFLSLHPFQVGSEKSTIKVEGTEALHYVALTGPLDRGRFIAMTGLGERTGRRFLASLLHYGLLKSESPRSPVYFSIPFPSLRFLFPQLWPEAEADTME